MELLQPWMLWGATGIVLPIAIHFWYQKKGEVLEWAASRWLFEDASLKHRGIRLYEILLLLIRCLLILLLALILSQPVLNSAGNVISSETVHIVEPDAAVVNEYRFELESALEKGEKVVWIDEKGTKMQGIGNISKVTDPLNYLQATINSIPAAEVKFKIYLTPKQRLLDQPKSYLPGAFSLFPSLETSFGKTLPYLATSEGKKLAVNPETGIFETFETVPAGYRFATAPVHSGPFYVLVKFKNGSEKQTVKAALEALTEVYRISFSIDENANAGRKYDWILSDQKPDKVYPQSLYVVTGQSEPVQHEANMHYLPDSLHLPASELVEYGRLPEWLGEIMTAHYRLRENDGLLSTQQLYTMFVEAKPAAGLAATSLRRWLLLLFVLLTVLERWLALRKTTLPTYG